MEQNRYGYEEEISLRELIEALLKRKKSIAVITIACIVIAGICSFVILKPSYEATAMLRLDGSPVATEDYAEQIKSQEVLSKTIEELGLADYQIDEAKLNKAVTVSPIEDTNLIEIVAKGSQPDIAADIANGMAVNSKAMLIPVYEKSLSDTGKSIELLKKMIEASTQELEQASQFVILKKNLVEDEALRAFFAQNGNGDSSLSVSINSEEMNTRYIVLQDKIFNDNISLIREQEESKNLQEKIDNINQEINGLAPINTYADSFIVSKAIPSQTPVSPNKTLNLAIGGVLGVMLGAFWAFFREYWENTSAEAISKKKKETNEIHIA